MVRWGNNPNYQKHENHPKCYYRYILCLTVARIKIIVGKNIDLDVVKEQILSQKWVYWKYHVWIFYSQRDNIQPANVYQPFSMENITSTHLVLVHTKEMHLRKSYKRSSIDAELLAYKAKPTVPSNVTYHNKPLDDKSHTPWKAEYIDADLHSNRGS